MPDISIDNRTSFELSNGSQIKASSTSSDAGRSEALSLLVIDEAAHVEGLDELVDWPVSNTINWWSLHCAFQPQMVLATGFIKLVLTLK